jgi:hypothetical protein
MLPSTWRPVGARPEVGGIVDDEHNVGALGEGQ